MTRLDDELDRPREGSDWPETYAPTPYRFRDDGGDAEPTYLPVAGGLMIRDLDERPLRYEL